jgi:hypothetical protein
MALDATLSLWEIMITQQLWCNYVQLCATMCNYVQLCGATMQLQLCWGCVMYDKALKLVL